MGEVEEEVVVQRIAPDVENYRPLWSSFGFSVVGIPSINARVSRDVHE